MIEANGNFGFYIQELQTPFVIVRYVNTYDMKNILLTILIFFIYQVMIFFCGQHWLTDMLPVDDFAGSVAHVNELRNLLFHKDFSNWSSLYFCGSPNTYLWSSITNFIYLPFCLLFSPVSALKIGTLFYLGLAGTSLFCLCRALTRKWLLSFWAGIAYMASPILLFSTVHTGHINFPSFYACQPLVFWALWRLSGKPDRKRLFIASLCIMLAVWLDSERACTSLPFMVILLLILDLAKRKVKSWREFTRYLSRQLAWLGAAGGLALLLGAFFIIPAMIESKSIALFPDDVLTESRNIFGLNNPLCLLDRNGWIVRKLAPYLPDIYTFDAGNFYFGISIILLACLAYLARRIRDKRIRLARTAIFVCICLIWSASSRSIAENLTAIATAVYNHLEYSQEHPYLLPVIAFGVIGLIVLFLFLRRKIGCEPFSLIRIALATGLLLLIGGTSLFLALVKIPPYTHIRNPGCFLSALPPFLLTLAGVQVLHYFTEKLPGRAYILVISAAITVTIIDFYPYRAGFQRRVDPQRRQDFRSASTAMKESPLPGRYLSRESYNPLADLHTHFAQRPAAWYWLNWSCPKGTHRIFLQEIYTQIHHPESIERALALAGLFHVRFVTYDLTQGPPPPSTKSLRPLFVGERYAVFENLLCRDRVQLYETGKNEPLPKNLEELLDRKRIEAEVNLQENTAQDKISIEVKTQQPALLVLSQSCFPGWKVQIDGDPVTLQTIEETLPVIRLEAGSHRIRFQYRRCWYFYLTAIISILTLIFCIYFLVPFPGRKRFTKDI